MAYVPTDELAHGEGSRAESIANYKNLLAERDTKLAAARQSRGPGSDRWKRIETKLRTAEEHVRGIYAKLQRGTDARRISFFWFLIAASVLAVLEAPINKFMLDNILQGNNIDSYALSLFMTLTLLVLAHFAGHQARQIRGAYQETFYISNIVLVLLIVGILLICIGALTIGRAFYSVSGNIGPGGRDIFSEISRQVLSVGPWTAFVAALSDKAAFFLACMNSAGILVAFITAFVTHDSDKVYQSALDSERTTDKALMRLAGKYDSEVGSVAKRYAPRLANITAAYSSQNARVVELKRNRREAITDEDRYDLNQLDTMLQQAKDELAPRSRRSADMTGNGENMGEAASVSTFVPRR